jgi:hypothetical protein
VLVDDAVRAGLVPSLGRAAIRLASAFLPASLMASARTF